MLHFHRIRALGEGHYEEPHLLIPPITFDAVYQI